MPDASHHTASQCGPVFSPGQFSIRSNKVDRVQTRTCHSRALANSSTRTLKVVVKQHCWTTEVFHMLFEPRRCEAAFLYNVDAAGVSRLNASKDGLSRGISLPAQLGMLKHRVLHFKLTTRKLPVFFEPALDSLSRITVAPELFAKHVA